MAGGAPARQRITGRGARAQSPLPSAAASRPAPQPGR